MLPPIFHKLQVDGVIFLLAVRQSHFGNQNKNENEINYKWQELYE